MTNTLRILKKISRAFCKLKTSIETYTKSAISIFAGTLTLIASAILTFHSEAQIDMMESHFIWGTCQDGIAFFQGIIAQGYTALRYLPFQDGAFFRMNTGNASDVFLALIIVGWALALVGMFLIMNGVVMIYKQKLEKAQHRKV